MDTITVKKKDIISALEKNKKKHIKAYEKAVQEYDKIARKQIKEFEKELDKGNMGMQINLTTPINNSARYSKLINMFELELKDEIELSQSQFDEFIHDEFGWSRQAYATNESFKSPGVYSLQAGFSNSI